MIVQLTTWQCDICLNSITATKEVSMYDDPVIVPPDNRQWDYVDIEDQSLLACPDCLEVLKEKVNEQNPV